MAARFLALFVSDALQALPKLNHDLDDGLMLSVLEVFLFVLNCFRPRMKKNETI